MPTPTLGKGSKIFIDDKDFSGEGRAIDISLENDTVDATTYSSQWQESLVGIMKASVDYRGVWDRTSGGLDLWITSNFSVLNKGMTIIPGEPAVNGVTYNGKIISINHPISVPVDNVVALNASFQMDGSFGRGRVIEYEGTAAVGAQTGTGVDLQTAASGYSATSTMKWITTIHIFEFNGSGTYTVTLQESSDNGATDSYAAVSSGALAVSGGTAGLFINIDGPRERYCRAVTTVQSGNATCKFVAAVTPWVK
jgi:hypothetical protein